MIKEVKCKNCGHYHLVSYHSGKFFFDGEWRKRINFCEFCGEVKDDHNVESEFIG